MKKLFTSQRSEGKGNRFPFPSERRGQSPFTQDFFKFLLGFSLIIIASFAIIYFFGGGNS